MDDLISSGDHQAGELTPPAEHLRTVPESEPPAPPRAKKRPGPKTPKGKARMRLNAMRSGIYAKDAVIPGERLEDRQAHAAAVLASFERPTYIDTLLAARVASASWNWKRVERYQETEFARANNGSPVLLMPPGPEPDKITRADGHWSVQFFKALHELEAREKRRRGEAAPLARLDVQGGPEQ
jgi:hypothetical protein